MRLTLTHISVRRFRWSAWAFVLVGVWACLTVQTNAITQRQLYRNGINFFNLSTGCESGTVTLSGGDNIQKAFNFLVGQGVPDIAAAGIVGNLQAESSVNPHSVQDGDDSETLPPAIFNKLGYGIAQWTSEGRQKNLIAFAQSHGVVEGDLQIQLQFLWQEATTNYSSVLERTKAAATPEEAATQWMGPNISGNNRSGGFENPRADVAHEDVRQRNAVAIYLQYGGLTPGAVAGIAGGCASGDFVNNFIEYKQCWYNGRFNVPWPTKPEDTYAPYGNTTVCEGGCGPSAMAMIITNLTGEQVTPDVTAAYGAANGTRMEPGGSYWNIAEVVGSHWGLKSQELGTNVTAINQVLQSGGLVLASGRGPDPFTSGGHFIVIRAVTSDGMWLTGNSAGYDSSKAYDPAGLVASMNVHGDTWGLTKQ